MQNLPKKKQKSKIKGSKFEDLVKKTINSGSLWFDKGDLKTDNYLIECKTTDKKGFRITHKLLKKIWDEALNANKLPAMIVGITNSDNPDYVWVLEIKINKRKK